MTTLESGEILDRAEAVANDDEIAHAKLLESLQAKVSDLDDSNYRLRVENLRLRSRIEYRESCRSVEKNSLLSYR